MLTPLIGLALSAMPQAFDSSTYANAETEALVVQVRGRHAYQDALVRDYAARVHTRIDVGFGRSRFARVPPIVAHETAADIVWSLPNDLKVNVVGERAASVFPDEDIEAAFDRPWFVPRSLGDSIRMVDDDLPTTAALHPLARGAERYYHFAISDSLTLLIPGRTVRAVAVRVEPKELGPSLIAGDMWVDTETVEVVRLTFVFVGEYNWVAPDDPTPEDSADARRGNTWAQRIVKLEADLEYALFNRLYWMPYRQLVQLTIDIPWFLNLKVPVRFITTFSDYRVNESILPRFEIALDRFAETSLEPRPPRPRRYCTPDGFERDSALGQCNAQTGYARAGYAEGGGRWEVRYAPRDSLATYDDWTDELSLNLSSEDEERIRETIASLGELEEQLPAQWVGRMPHHFAVENFADIYRFNRVQGSSLGSGYQLRPGPAFTTLHGVARYGFSDRRVTGALTWRRDAPGGRLDLTAFRDVREVEPWTAGLGFGNSLNAIFAGHDDADYYLALGGGITFGSNGRGLLRNAEFGVFFERQRTMAAVASSGVNDRLGGNGIFQANTPVLEDDFVRAYVTRRSNIGPFDLRQRAEGLFSESVASTRLWAVARLPFSILQRTGELNLRGGQLVGDEVLQMLYRAGGPATVRGYDYGERLGTSLWSAQLDFALNRGVVFSPVLFADAGDVSFRRFDPLVSVGGGVSILDGIARLNLAKGLEQDRGLRFDLLFQAPR